MSVESIRFSRKLETIGLVSSAYFDIHSRGCAEEVALEHLLTSIATKGLSELLNEYCATNNGSGLFTITYEGLTVYVTDIGYCNFEAVPPEVKEHIDLLYTKAFASNTLNSTSTSALRGKSAVLISLEVDTTPNLKGYSYATVLVKENRSAEILYLWGSPERFNTFMKYLR